MALYLFSFLRGHTKELDTQKSAASRGKIPHFYPIRYLISIEFGDGREKLDTNRLFIQCTYLQTPRKNTKKRQARPTRERRAFTHLSFFCVRIACLNSRHKHQRDAAGSCEMSMKDKTDTGKC